MDSFADYMVEVAVAAAFGPYSTVRHMHDIASADSIELRKEAVGKAVAVEAGALAMQYSMLQFLNYVQGPKYAMSFHQMHASLNPIRGMVIKQVLPGAAAAYGGHELGTTAMRNVAIEPVGGVKGAYRLSAKEEPYYPGKSLIDLLF